MANRFIQKVFTKNKSKGSLTNYVYATFGSKGFTKSKKTGHWIIKPSLLAQLGNKKHVCVGNRCTHPSHKIGQKARFAKLLGKLRKM